MSVINQGTEIQESVRAGLDTDSRLWALEVRQSLEVHGPKWVAPHLCLRVLPRRREFHFTP